MTFSIPRRLSGSRDDAVFFWTKGLSADTQVILGKAKANESIHALFSTQCKVLVMIKDAEDPSILQSCLRVCAPNKIWLPQQTTLALPQIARGRAGGIHGKVRDVLLQSISTLHSLL